ncbi:MAG: hypothetical protein N0C84_20430 [Candidatus Thiodiazotropha taylori]|uniref:Uncharacterized protein n=1 Tax=Candidatus Thiodiazotropha taylori TaxID=2792791 RepID=A0A9E4N740_9GAMM|nr:hypothetical protein [Candidatus Thiodiazotropha taylori]MCW4258836.1 hypothetical protein [Candidatus Thiodiazotropha taylori]
MFKKILNREKPRVYLGALAVAPRADIKRHVDQWGMFQNEDLDTGLRQNLKEIFSLPSAKEVAAPKSNDLVLDVVIPKFQSGDAWDLTIGDLGIPLMWRPKVTVSSRLYYLKSEKTKATFSVTEKMKLGHYIGRLFTWRAIFRFRPIFDSKDMEYLLYQACYKLLQKMQKAT